MCCFRNIPRGTAVIRCAGWEQNSWSDHTQHHHLVQAWDEQEGKRKTRQSIYSQLKITQLKILKKSDISFIISILSFLQGGKNNGETWLSSGITGNTELLQNFQETKTQTRTLLENLIVVYSFASLIIALTIPTMGNICCLCFHPMNQNRIWWHICGTFVSKKNKQNKNRWIARMFFL